MEVGERITAKLKMKTRYKYIHFELTKKLPKTEVWRCRNNKSLGFLGTVKWDSGWRQYCFFTEGGCKFSSSCEMDIADFLVQVNKGHKAKNAES